LSIVVGPFILTFRCFVSKSKPDPKFEITDEEEASRIEEQAREAQNYPNPASV
jgi:hypothetical protein